ncbi:hypothetical protein SAMN05216349_1501, partial [Oribacterium sp. KHPX15]|uniref:DUF6273 domain-containing protein n=1 Tax=Oribacterium sp. KHPX15 TaxID=1855342 RepID=UPI0008950200
ITAFEQLNGYRDSVEQINSCKICIQDIVYNEAKKLKDNGEYKKAISKYLSLGDYQDSAEQIVECELSKMKDAKTGSWITFGAYEQDNDFSNGKEEITWIVLKRTNDSILVTSEYALDCQQYNTQSGVRDATTWEKCSLRKWLNEDFLNSAFSEAEQMHIKNETIPAYKNPDYNTDPGNPTTDKVFLLSINEADKYLEYGFERACHPTEYAKTQGVWINERTECCWWWLRTPGSSGFYAALVNHEGSIVPRGGHVNDDDNSTGVRPVLWISID